MYQLFFLHFLMGYFLPFNEFWSFLGFFPSLSNRWRSTQNNALEIHEDKSDFNGLFSKVWYFETLLPWGQLGTRRELLKTRGVQGFQDNRRQTFKHESHLKCSGFPIYPSFKTNNYMIEWERGVVGTDGESLPHKMEVVEWGSEEIEEQGEPWQSS